MSASCGMSGPLARPAESPRRRYPTLVMQLGNGGSSHHHRSAASRSGGPSATRQLKRKEVWNHRTRWLLLPRWGNSFLPLLCVDKPPQEPPVLR